MTFIWDLEFAVWNFKNLVFKFFFDFFGHSKNQKNKNGTKRSRYSNQSNHAVSFKWFVKINEEDIYYYQRNSNKKKNVGKNFHEVHLEDKNTKIWLYANRPLTLAANNLTAIAKSTMPKTFRMMLNPFSPSIFSILAEDFKTKYTKIIFNTMATIIFTD